MLTLLVLVFVALVHRAPASLLSQSSVVRCDDHDDRLDCREKLLVSMVVENDRAYSTDHLEVSVGCVSDGDGGGEKCLETNMTIGITKTPASLLYALSNPTMYNGRPWEQYVETGAGSGRGTCVDSEFRSDATCGWATLRGSDVPDSQGFCCKCPSFGGDSIYRGFRDCSYSMSWVLDGAASSAHCLRYDDNWWYRGYQIGTYQIDFQIQVHIDAPTLNTTETLTLSPVRTVAPSGRGDVVAELVGDFAAYAELSSLRDHWLMIPVQPGLSPNQIFTSNLDMWSIFEQSLVSTNGECDKIGVSYTAFRYQTEACDRPFGSCLNNQIFHYEMEDQERAARGLSPLYNIRRYGGGTDNVGQALQGPDGLLLKLPMAQMRSSVVTLSIKADDMTFVTNAGRATIVDASLDEFAAIDESGRLRVSVNNTSAKPAMFHVSVVNCTAELLPMLQQSAAVEAGGLRTFEFDVRARTDLAATNATCAVVVSNALGDVTDTRAVNFTMTATAYAPLPEQGTPDGSDPTGDPPQFLACSARCPNILSLKCSLLHGCWKRFFTGVTIIGSLLGALYALYAGLPLIRRLRDHRGRGDGGAGASRASHHDHGTREARQLRPASPDQIPRFWFSNPSYDQPRADHRRCPWNHPETSPKNGSCFATDPIGDAPK